MTHLYWVALKSIWAKEINRFARIWIQTLVPPVITMTLYFIIFGPINLLEVGHRIPSTESLGSNIIGSCCFIFFIECPEPNTLVLLVNLCTPATIWLGDNTFVFGRREFS